MPLYVHILCNLSYYIFAERREIKWIPLKLIAIKSGNSSSCGWYYSVHKITTLLQMKENNKDK